MLKLEDISFSYKSYSRKGSEKLLFNHLDLMAGEKEKVLILGECGSGKTTLSLVISHLVPSYVEGELKGKILFNGRECEKASDLLSFFSLIPQNPGDYFLTTSVESELAGPLEALGLEKSEMKGRMEELLKEWNLSHYRDREPSCLSGGEKKRLAIALALITKPSIAVFDESFDDLDSGWKERLGEVINKRAFTSIVTSSRFLSCFAGLFDSIYLLHSGQLKPISEEEACQVSAWNVNIKRGRTEEGRIEACNLHFTRDTFSLTVPSFTLKRGEVASLGGVNGSGKTTFSRILCGLERSEGRVMINGNQMDAKGLMRSVGYVFQNPDCQLFLPTVRDELSYSMDYLKLKKGEKEKRLETLAEFFSLDLDESAMMLSYGGHKRLQCAIYYSLKRPYYILDEIEAALPYRESTRMVELLLSQGSGVLVISHETEFASRIASKSWKIEEGVLHESQLPL